MLCIGAVFGQGQTISGTVLDKANEPVIGATVMVEGTTTGTITDFDGKFSINCAVGAELVFSYMGYQTTKQKAANGMIVRMQEDNTELDEVMVVGYSTSTKKSYVGSAAVVSGEVLEKKNATEVSKALAGEVAGVNVITTSGQPGTNASIRIRGIGSVNSSTSPLYVVDGVPYDGDISNIDPGDIASTTVLKDATATSLYGSRGANGVILITTKRGSSDTEGKIDIDFKYGANMRLIPMYETIQSAQRYVELGWQGLRNNTGSADMASSMLFGNKGIPSVYNLWTDPGNALIDPVTGRMYPDATFKPGIIAQPLGSWDDNIFRVGQKMEATVKIHGGSDKTTYYTSFGYLKDEGYYDGSDYNRLTARANVDHQAKKWLKGNMNMSYAYSEFNNPGQGSNMNNGFAYVNGIPAIYPVFQRDADGYKVQDPLTGGYSYDYGMYEGGGRLFGSGINPAGALQLDKSRQIQNAFTGNAMLEITFIKGLTLSANFGLQ